MAEAAKDLREAVLTDIECCKEEAAAEAEQEKAQQGSVNTFKLQLAIANSKLAEMQQQCKYKKARVESLETKQRAMQAASDRKAIDIAAAAIADGTLQLHKRIPDGLLRQLTTEQKQHFKRLLPGVKLVSQRSVFRLALRSQTTHVVCSCGCVFAQSKLRLLYRGSKDGFTPAAFWQRCEGKSNTLKVVKVSRCLLAQLSSRRHRRASAHWQCRCCFIDLLR